MNKNARTRNEHRTKFITAPINNVKRVAKNLNNKITNKDSLRRLKNEQEKRVGPKVVNKKEEKGNYNERNTRLNVKTASHKSLRQVNKNVYQTKKHVTNKDRTQKDNKIHKKQIKVEENKQYDDPYTKLNEDTEVTENDSQAKSNEHRESDDNSKTSDDKEVIGEQVKGDESKEVEIKKEESNEQDIKNT